MTNLQAHGSDTVGWIRTCSLSSKLLTVKVFKKLQELVDLKTRLQQNLITTTKHVPASLIVVTKRIHVLKGAVQLLELCKLKVNCN